jgi:hypothetical protein
MAVGVAYPAEIADWLSDNDLSHHTLPDEADCEIHHIMMISIKVA